MLIKYKIGNKTTHLEHERESDPTHCCMGEMIVLDRIVVPLHRLFANTCLMHLFHFFYYFFFFTVCQKPPENKQFPIPLCFNILRLKYVMTV